MSGCTFVHFVSVCTCVHFVSGCTCVHFVSGCTHVYICVHFVSGCTFVHCLSMCMCVVGFLIIIVSTVIAYIVVRYDSEVIVIYRLHRKFPLHISYH